MVREADPSAMSACLGIDRSRRAVVHQTGKSRMRGNGNVGVGKSKAVPHRHAIRCKVVTALLDRQRSGNLRDDVETGDQDHAALPRFAYHGCFGSRG